MLTLFCPFSSCAARVPYEAIKPTKCPQCGKLFADAFRVVTPTTAAYAPRPVVVLDDDPPAPSVMRQTLLKARAAKRVSTRAVVATDDDPEIKSHIMNAGDVPTDVSLPIETFDDEEPERAPHMVSRRARELLATIDPASIVVADQDEGVERFETYWNAGAAARESGAKAPKVTKRKARR